MTEVDTLKRLTAAQNQLLLDCIELFKATFKFADIPIRNYQKDYFRTLTELNEKTYEAIELLLIELEGK